MNITIHTDGGAKGNPGPAAIGAVIAYDGKTKEYAEEIGSTTNNVAEYSALIFALKKARQLVGKEGAKRASVTCVSDSELMVKQLNKEYKIKNEELGKLFIEVWNLSQEFRSVTYSHVLREKNKRADELLNNALNKKKLL